ncbi:SusD/RagB family nutrient-binding outer membrane lipoprotein [Galbibacter sp. EGI 63066]|uniref:SusD/RagB family nutrient-binding outer membrane lipoprotein n=1 Tax=Galbibacter sp. EGI 63066 TaxID=2993559 RepID=UPI002248C6C3|nr:SusD/RagB family nutrient-binding outer membrane lipoprotein [Galbibacter sp. EGI 63066]MCX2679496.1 SusD/RagB family nutrient-binding outer membrane lipoprotein [Galbibacter sp. EGI 63066]
MLLAVACDVDYEDNPNEPSSVPTSALFNNNMKRMVDASRDGFFSGRFTYATMQYWQQSEYGDEDRYVYRESMRQTQNTFYEIAENFREIIELNEDPTTKDAAASSGANVNQIAVSRIMLSYLFNNMADTWGDIPYYSYGSDDPDFEALRTAGYPDEEQILTPKYATQDKIYADILNELSEAQDQLNLGLDGMDGDNLYHGDVSKWKLFANSLRLKIANKIKGADASLANTHINDAISDGVFTSNSDNAMFAYETSDVNASPMYRAWHVNNRSDFAVGHSFVTLLKGENLVDHTHTSQPAGANPNPFSGLTDPRLPIYAQENSEGNFVGMFISESSADAATFTVESLPGSAIIDTPEFAETLLEYSEICFIQSELNGWDQDWYEMGISASMEKWGVASADATAYLGTVPAANMENVLTQKYIALYMQGTSSWTEYRRTGYPKTLIPPHQDYSLYIPSTDTWLDKTFNPLVEQVTDLPYRMRYPAQEQTLNGANRKEAADRLSNGDVIYSKLWWDVN